MPGAPSPSINAQPGILQQQAVGMDEPVPNYAVGNTQSALLANAAQTYVTTRATLYLFAPSTQNADLNPCKIMLVPRAKPSKVVEIEGPSQ